MVDHEERQILQKLEDDALENARKAAQEQGQQELEQQPAEPTESPTDEDNPASGVDDSTLTY